MKITRKKLFPKKNPFNLEEFNNLKKTILIYRNGGGLGDIFMHRMLFEDFKSFDVEIHFACSRYFMPAAENHPFIDKLLCCEDVSKSDYLMVFDTSFACIQYENKVAPYVDKHRSDIWAEHCGVNLTKHNMHLSVPDTKKELIKTLSNGKPTVFFSPISQMMSKSLLDKQIKNVVFELQKQGFFVYSCHTSKILGIDCCFTKCSISEYMEYIAAADYVISVDTATFHCAGGLNKPLVGIFSWSDGKVYGKYFNFNLVQKHRDNGDWDCGPCQLWSICPKCPTGDILRKPCISEISVKDILNSFNKLLY